jgi:acetylglutamate kinase
MIHDPQLEERAAILIEALPYIQNFRGQTFVIKYGGSAMDDPHQVDRLLRDVVFLEAVGINPVLVHGGGKAITAKMKEAGLGARFVNGLRVTDAATIELVQATLDGEINPQIVKTLQRFGGRAQGLSGREVFRAELLAPQPDEHGHLVDVGFVGEAVGVELAATAKLILDEVVPVISPVGAGPDETILNINADVAAAALAGGLKAHKLIFVSDVPGILRQPGAMETLIPSVSTGDIEILIAEKVLGGGMLPKVRSAAKALEHGVGKVHFICGAIPHALLLEVFTQKGIGTEIVRTS